MNTLDNRYYHDLSEITYHNWRMCFKRGQIEYIRKNLSEGDEKLDLVYLERLQDQYLKEVGLSKDTLYLIELQIELIELRLEYVIEDKNYTRNRIRRIEREIEELQTKDNGVDDDTVLTYLRKWMGTWIDTKVISALEFYRLYRDYTREIQTLKQQNNG